MLKTVLSALTVGLFLTVPNVYSQDIIHDAEYAIIEAQNGEQWAKDDQAIDIMLADILPGNEN